jgi:hypothetical protein
VRNFRGANNRPHSNTGDPVVDRALRELGEPAALTPALEYDRGRLGLSRATEARIAKLEENVQPPHKMRTATDSTGGEVTSELSPTAAVAGSGADAAINAALAVIANNFATMQSQIDRLHAIGVERGQIQ